MNVYIQCHSNPIVWIKWIFKGSVCGIDLSCLLVMNQPLHHVLVVDVVSHDHEAAEELTEKKRSERRVDLRCGGAV